MKGIDFIGKNILEIAGEELGATKLWEQYRETFTTVHYVSGIDVFDSYFGNIKFCQTNATLQIISCTKAILFVLTHVKEREIFGFNREQIKELKIEDNAEIQVRTINRLTALHSLKQSLTFRKLPSSLRKLALAISKLPLVIRKLALAFRKLPLAFSVLALAFSVFVLATRKIPLAFSVLALATRKLPLALSVFVLAFRIQPTELRKLKLTISN
jgi:hypothetical protein